MSDKPTTDLSYLREMAMGDDDIIIETAEMFMEDIPRSVEKMKAYTANEQWEELAKIAHKIKPNLSYMGMERGRELIIDIEEEANSGSISADIQDKISEFDEICSQAVKELTVKVGELKS